MVEIPTGLLNAIIIWFLYGIWSGMVGIWFYKRGQRRADVKFLKELHVKYPDLPVQYFYSIDASSQEALEKLRKQVQEHIRQHLQPPQHEKQDIPVPPPPPPPPADPTEYIP